MTVLSEIELNSEFIAESYENIIKSVGDKREYKGMVLRNGLKVLLISDVEADKSAAALDVAVGAMSDPREVQGLAHFLEHMLFLGTGKYPVENDYKKYISSNGGASNAYTSPNNTNYHFDISTDFLAGALDRFAQFFIEPLFTESATEREMNAVHSEYERNIPMDSRRLSHLQRSLSDPTHDYSKFSTGNMETLKEIPIAKGIDVRQELLSFHERWYSANIMSLVVLGKEGPKQWIFDELKQIREIRFRFKEKERPMGYVIDLSHDLHDFPFDECLSAGYLLDEFRPDLITDLLNHLTPDRMRVTVVSKQFTTIADQTEKWYSTQYTQQDIPPEKIQKWLNIGFNDNLALPLKNDFIPYDFTLKQIDDNLKQMPQMIRNTEFSRVWHLQDNQYRTPKAYYKFKLTNPHVYDSPMHANASTLWTRVFMDSINEYSYSAQLAGLSYNFYRTVTGLELTFGGYNDKLNSLMTTVLDKLIEFKVNPKKFEVFKDKQIRGLKSYQSLSKPQLLGYYMNATTSDRYWTYEELLDTAYDISVDDVSALVSQLLSRFHIEALIHGNIDSSEAIDVCDVFESRFKSALNTKP
ncbi:unnamed protein product, partial [Oppiella nova]